VHLSLCSRLSAADTPATRAWPQYCTDIVDTFEGNLGKNNEDGATLKAFLEGGTRRDLASREPTSCVAPADRARAACISRQTGGRG
jgi:hypothetical protein